jgi:chemotaxis protein CheX
MTEQTIQVFIDGVVRYFEHVADKEIQIGSPYLVENNSPAAYDVTGLIGISGPYKGCVYFTSPKILLKHVLMSIGEHDTGNENIFDLVGEVANTISGNARSVFGQDFMISVPVMIEGAPSHIHLPSHLRSYVIPVYWRAYHAAVVICLDG